MIAIIFKKIIKIKIIIIIPAKENVTISWMKDSFFFLRKFNKLLSFKHKGLEYINKINKNLVKLNTTSPTTRSWYRVTKFYRTFNASWIHDALIRIENLYLGFWSGTFRSPVTVFLFVKTFSRGENTYTWLCT